MVLTFKKIRAVPLLRLLIVLGVAGLAFLIFSGGVGMHSYSDSDPAYNTAYWEEQVRMRGSAKAFALFTQKNEAAPRERQHFSAHVFGVVLAEHEGVNGITSCDASFGYGCYHGFFSKIISEGGEAFIARLDEVCVTTYGPFGTGCQHGIGHGILEYVGYNRVTDALRLCGQTTQKVPLLGCTSGVFMEYFTPLAQKGEFLSQEQKIFDETHPEEPCDIVDAAYKESCYFELGHYYYMHFKGDGQRMANLCTQIPGRFVPYCFLGLGDLQGPVSGYRLEESVRFCDAFSDDGRVACRAGLSWSFFANPMYREQAKGICALSQEQDTAECNRLADLTLGQANQ